MMFVPMSREPEPEELDLRRSEELDRLSQRLKCLINAALAGKPLPEDPRNIERESRRLRYVSAED